MAVPHSKGAAAYCSILAQVVGEVVFKRMDELEKMPLMELVEFSSRATDICLALRGRAIAAGA